MSWSDWPTILIVAAVAAVQQFVTHKRWQALIQAIRDKNRDKPPDTRR